MSLTKQGFEIVNRSISQNLFSENTYIYKLEIQQGAVLGGRLGTKKWVQANFIWPKFSEVGEVLTVGDGFRLGNERCEIELYSFLVFIDEVQISISFSIP